MPATYEYQLFELDRVEQAFKAIILEAVNSVTAPVQVLMKRESQSDSSPRVELVLSTQQVQGQRYILNPTQTDMRWQPLNTWLFRLAASVFTERERNGDQHLPLVGKTRLALQFYKLAQSWTEARAPYHTIVDIREEPIELAIENEGNLDRTTISFAGMLCIRDGAWVR